MPQVRYLILFLLLFQLAACAKADDSGKVFTPGFGHADNWSNPNSIGKSDFHATAVKIAGSEANGPRLFTQRCSLCHGSDASGRIGPDIRGTDQFPTTVELITGAILAIPLMRGQSDLSPGDKQDLADYIAGLRSGGPQSPAVVDSSLCAQCHGAGLDGGIARISCFSCHIGSSGGIGHPAGWGALESDETIFHGKYGRDFAAACTACHGVALNLTIMPSGTPVTPCASCHDDVIAPTL